MRAFVMLRGVLARLIERLLTLDRLLFLHEAYEAAGTAQQAGITYAEEIFDPSISPRSTAIVAAWPADECAPCDE